MAAFPITPHISRPLIRSISVSATSTSRNYFKTNARVSVQASPATFSDPFVLELAETLEDSLPSSSSPPLPLLKLRDSSSHSLLSTPWPSRKDEAYRFTDISFIRHSQILPVSQPPPASVIERSLVDSQFPNVVIIDGHFVKSVSNLADLPSEVYVGSLLELPSETIIKRISDCIDDDFEGDLFWSINGMGAADMTVIYVPEGCRLENPIHLKYVSMEGGNEGSNTLPLSNPRVFVLIEKGAEVNIIEEFLCGEGSMCYWANSVMEMVLGEGAKVKHSYVQSQSSSSAHTKWTLVQQDSTSSYELLEASTGGKLSRHNLHVQQLGPDTITELHTLHLSVGDQTQDLHSRLVLDHPRGYSRQLHKCIVANSLGQAVFDGNVKVNRHAQQTDAGQLTRSLLLEPRATVNVKPNLQIIADDVKCSHGAAISDLEETQLFYFLARGIDLKMARKALIFSFGAEVIERLPHPSVRKQVESHIKELLDPTLERS